VAAVSLPARGRPPQAAARRAGLDTYGHLFPSEMDTLGDRLELVRDVAVARLGRTQHGPADSRLGESAGG
jgi:hypothetical protein